MLIYDYDGVLMNPEREFAVTTYNKLTDHIVTQLEQLPTNALA
jgi:hypothetical protein